MTAQIHGCPQVDLPPAQQSAQGILDLCQAKEPDMRVRLEFNENVNIAGLGKTIGKNRTEEREPTNAIVAA